MNSVQRILGLSTSPIAVAFSRHQPPGMPRWDLGAVPAGCAFWRYAMAGNAFYTEPSDHFNCAVGSYTHAIPLPTERSGELNATIGFMVSSRYLEMSEVPAIPVLPTTPRYVAYSPVDSAPFPPDVVIAAAAPASAMLLYEAAVRSGAGAAVARTLGRPGCAAIPLAHQSGQAVLSFGCKGNRTFTGLPDHEMYFVVPGSKWHAVTEALDIVVAANSAMGAYYESKRARFPILT